MGGRVVVDSAFPLDLSKPYFDKSTQMDPFGSPELNKNRNATSVHQLLEWGMRLIQEKFSRIKDGMKYKEAGERKIILQLLVLLFNFYTTKVGMNSITNRYLPALSTVFN